MLERTKVKKSTGERSAIQAAVERRKRKVAKPSAPIAPKPTVPKGPSMLERPKKTMPKPKAQKESDVAASKIPDHLSEFRKYKPSNSVLSFFLFCLSNNIYSDPRIQWSNRSTSWSGKKSENGQRKSGKPEVDITGKTTKSLSGHQSSSGEKRHPPSLIV